MSKENLQFDISEDVEKMSFNELQKYVHNSLTKIGDEITRWEVKEVSKVEDEVSRLIVLLESKILEGLIVKGQKSIKTLQQEFSHLERKKLRIHTQKNTELSDNLQKLYLLREAIIETELTQDFLEKAYLQMCRLQNEYFDIYYRNKYRDVYHFSPQLDRKYQSKFAKELPFLLNQAIQKLENSIQKQKNSQLRILEFDALEELAKKAFEKEIDQKSGNEITRRREIVVSIRSRKRKTFTKSLNDIPTKKLPWKFFPKGQWTVEQIVKEFSNYISQNEIIDESRIWKIYDNLNPSDCYISQDGFNRYIAFCFDWTEKVVLECPIYGNAIYIIKDDWQEITKLHKWQARRSHKVIVIDHSYSWFSRLKTNLKNLY